VTALRSFTHSMLWCTVPGSLGDLYPQKTSTKFSLAGPASPQKGKRAKSGPSGVLETSLLGQRKANTCVTRGRPLIFSALKHRYNLPISLPPTTTSTLLPKPSTLPSRAPGPSPDFGASQTPLLSSSTAWKPSRDAPRIDFDPSLVAKKGDHWEEMFERLLMRWLEEASTEAREQTPGGFV
jgi:hypothetical protein